jgi:hypothetical protein
MVSPLVFSQIGLIALVWVFLVLSGLWPSESAAARPMPPTPLMPRGKRSKKPQPFPGLTRQPSCAACEQAIEAPRLPPSPPPPPIPATRGRRRHIDTSQHCCPDPACRYGGWLGLGTITSNGLPTICQPRFVNFLPHLHDWLTTNAAGIIAGAMTQHGHKNTQQSVANSA